MPTYITNTEVNLRTIEPETAPDELLLHSGGPISDISQSSLLMGPPTHRTLFRQPENENSFPPEQSPLDGILTFHSSNPLIVEQQIWRNSKWDTIETAMKRIFIFYQKENLKEKKKIY